MTEDIERYSKIVLRSNIDTKSKQLIPIGKTVNWSYGAGLQSGIIFMAIRRYNEDKNSKMFKSTAHWSKKIIDECLTRLKEDYGFKATDFEELFDMLGIKPKDLT